jgi:hypothetical protein
LSNDPSLLSWDICLKYQRDLRVKEEKKDDKKKENHEEKKFKFDEISELRDRAMLF